MTLRLNGSTSGYTEIDAPAVAGNNTLTLPSTTGGTLVATDSTGNLGIGTASPTVPLDVVGQARVVSGAVDTRIVPLPASSSAVVGTWSNHNYVFQTNNAERVRITTNGALWVGYAANANSSPGVISAVGYAGKQGTGGSTFTNIFNFNWSGSFLEAWVDNVNVGTVTLTSDYRIKKNIESQIDLAIPRIKQLRPVTFEYANYGTAFKEDGVHREGFIAHELAEVIPSGVEGEKDAENQIQSIRIDAVVSVLTKALQEAIAQIETLESRIAALEATP